MESKPPSIFLMGVFYSVRLCDNWLVYPLKKAQSMALAQPTIAPYPTDNQPIEGAIFLPKKIKPIQMKD